MESLNYLTKYEEASLKAARVKQLFEGQSSTTNTNTTNIIEKVDDEFEQKKIPLKLIREFPNGKIEIINLRNMKKL